MGTFLVQDHERCLWTAEPHAAMKALNIERLDMYPKCSQDLNPIEVAWRELRARLDDTQPTSMECRQGFLARLRLAVAWVNKNRAEYLAYLCTCQKEWASDVQEAKGGRTKH